MCLFLCYYEKKIDFSSFSRKIFSKKLCSSVKDHKVIFAISLFYSRGFFISIQSAVGTIFWSSGFGPINLALSDHRFINLSNTTSMIFLPTSLFLKKAKKQILRKKCFMKEELSSFCHSSSSERGGLFVYVTTKYAYGWRLRLQSLLMIIRPKLGYKICLSEQCS